MELNSIESHMEKVVQYLEELSKSDKKLYSKTRTRLGALNTQLCRSVEMVSQILADNILKQDTEFGENLGELNDEAISINKDISSTMTHVTQLNTFIDRSDSAKAKREILLKYKEVLHQVAVMDIKYPHVLNCAKLINKWFNCRFYLSLSFDSNFKYRLEMLPQWIVDIVTLYGYCISISDFSEIEQFMHWCDNVGSGVITTTYAVPYCIHRISHSMTKDMVTFSGLGLYDLLLDAGYSRLDDPALGNVTLSPYLLKDKFLAYSPDVVDDYTYCGDDESLLKKYKLIGG